jgi:hypothetical protein
VMRRSTNGSLAPVLTPVLTRRRGSKHRSITRRRLEHVAPSTHAVRGDGQRRCMVRDVRTARVQRSDVRHPERLTRHQTPSASTKTLSPPVDGGDITRAATGRSVASRDVYRAPFAVRFVLEGSRSHRRTSRVRKNPLWIARTRRTDGRQDKSAAVGRAHVVI